MNNTVRWKVRFSEKLDKIGDAENYLFEVIDLKDAQTSSVIVKVAREATLKPEKEVAANAVRLHLQGYLKQDDYDEKGKIRLTSYSAFRNGVIEDYEEFEVLEPSKGMGFIPQG